MGAATNVGEYLAHPGVNTLFQEEPEGRLHHEPAAAARDGIGPWGVISLDCPVSGS